MKRVILSVFFGFITLLFSVLRAQTVFTHAKAERVQLYFNGAEIQQSANLALPKGTSEVVIMNVANQLDESSIQIKSAKTATILSVQFSNQPVVGYDQQFVSDTARPIWDSIQNTEKEIKKNALLRKSVQKSLEILDKNQQLTNQNMTTAELSKLLDYHKSKRFELEKQLNDLSEESDRLQKKLGLLKFRMGTASSQNVNNRGKIILQVMNETEGKVPFQLNYISYQARWSPFYEVRSEKINAPITLKYNAGVSQSTGVDWNNVKLSLSSGYVNQQTTAPVLSPWFINYDKPAQPAPMVRQRAAFSKNMETKQLNEVVEQDIMLEEKSLQDVVVVNETQFNTVFDIDLPYTILSNAKKHSVALRTIEIPATYKYYTVPKYDLGAYLVGEIEDYGKYNLLRGEANLIFEGIYVGKTVINPENASKKLTLSLGKDRNIRIDRKLVSQNTENKSFSSKKVQTFTYEITMQNNKRELVEIEVEDQIPLSTNKEIKVHLVSSDNATFDASKGKLQWRIQLKPNENKKVKFTYQVESDKESNVSNL